MKITTSASRVRTSFDPEYELPKLHRWFAENPHPSRLTLQMYVKELNGLSSRQSRKLLEVHNLCYWFKNARAAYKRAELRLKKNHNEQRHQTSLFRQSQTGSLSSSLSSPTAVSTSVVSQANFSRDDKSLISNGTRNSAYNFSLREPGGNSTTVEQSSPSCEIGKLDNTRASPKLGERLYGEETKQSSGDLSLTMQKLIGSHTVTGAWNEQQSAANMSAYKPFKDLVRSDAGASSREIGVESPSRADSNSPSSTVSTMTTPSMVLPPAQNNIDIASAVNCLLSRATNFTAAVAAAAAAAAAASTTLNSVPIQQPNLLPGPSSAAINLAALLSSNLGVQLNPIAAALAADPSSLAAVLSGQSTLPVTMPATNLAIDQPIRHLFSAFNPSSYQFSLGSLDNKVLDSKVLNAMVFPTSSCSPDAAFSFAGPGVYPIGCSVTRSNNKHHHSHHNQKTSLN